MRQDGTRDLQGIIAWRSRAPAQETVGKLAAIDCPTLVVTGELDAGSTPEMARAMAAQIPRAELEIVPDQRHMLPLLDSQRVNARLLEFLARVHAPR